MLHDQLKAIKTQLRLAMNGAASQSMREKGLDYKLNFGIEYPRIREIAADFPKDHKLAQALWKENIRECKILAGLLQPIDSFCPELADIWIEDMHYPELAQYTVMNLFQHLPKRVIPIETKDYPTPAARPHYSVLNKGKIKATYGMTIPHWETSLQSCLQHLLNS